MVKYINCKMHIQKLDSMYLKHGIDLQNIKNDIYYELDLTFSPT